MRVDCCTRPRMRRGVWVRACTHRSLPVLRVLVCLLLQFLFLYLMEHHSEIRFVHLLCGLFEESSDDIMRWIVHEHMAICFQHADPFVMNPAPVRMYHPEMALQGAYVACSQPIFNKLM